MNADQKQKILAVAAEALAEWEQKLAYPDWKVDKDSHGIVIAKSKIFAEKKRPICWKAEFIVEGDIERVRKLLAEHEIRKKWDKTTEEFKVLEKVSDTVILTYEKSSSVGPISSRDFVDARNYITKKEGDRIVHFRMAGTSIEFDEYPPQKKIVRGKGYSSGIQLDCIEVDGKSCTKVIMINQVDINGWIPESVVNAAMTGQMYQMAQHVQKKAKDDDFWKE